MPCQILSSDTFNVLCSDTCNHSSHAGAESKNVASCESGDSISAGQHVERA